MSQSNPILDHFAKMMTDAAGVASSAKREVDTMVKSQIERLLRDADVVTREEFEAVKEMVAITRDENEKLSTRIFALEAKLGLADSSSSQTP
jgi:BMFP domain-containing protein YqiC